MLLFRVASYFLATFSRIEAGFHKHLLKLITGHILVCIPIYISYHISLAFKRELEAGLVNRSPFLAFSQLRMYNSSSLILYNED